MGAYKNHEFIGMMEREEERERMELARREQDYLNSRRAKQTTGHKATTQTPPKKGK